MSKNNIQYYEQVPTLIGVKTNIEGFYWGFGKCRKPVPENTFEQCKIKVFLEERADKHVFDGIDRQAYPYSFRNFRASDTKLSVLFEQSFKKAVKLRFVLTVDGNNVRVVVGRSYRRFLKVKLMYVHAMAYILFDMVSMLLLQNGLTTLYCAAVKMPDGKTVVLTAPPNTGKSLCALKLRSDCGAEILAEDMAVTDGVHLWGAPDTNLYRDYHDETLAAAKSGSSCFYADAVDVLAMLQKGGKALVKEVESFGEHMTLINHYSLGYYYSPCVRVLSYYHDLFSVEKAEQTEKHILEQLQASARCVWLGNSEPIKFSQQIQGVLYGL